MVTGANQGLVRSPGGPAASGRAPGARSSAPPRGRTPLLAWTLSFLFLSFQVLYISTRKPANTVASCCPARTPRHGATTRNPPLPPQGYQTSLELARRGATLFMVCRNEARGLEAVERVRADSGNQDVHLKVGREGRGLTPWRRGLVPGGRRRAGGRDGVPAAAPDGAAGAVQAWLLCSSPPGTTPRCHHLSDAGNQPAARPPEPCVMPPPAWLLPGVRPCQPGRDQSAGSRLPRLRPAPRRADQQVSAVHH